MKMVVFGLTISSSWGNGHATLWRGLQAALARRGWTVVFFERDVPYYAVNRDLHALPGGELVLYRDWADARGAAARHLAEADVAIVTSYCPDAVAATALVLQAGRPLAVFYDLDTPVTLAALGEGRPVPYLPAEGLGGFDLVLSYTGGRALDELATRLQARRTAPLYGHVDPATHVPVGADPRFRADLSYIGTYAEDRQTALEALFVEPARRREGSRFVLAGAQYPADFPWTPNIFFVRHLPPEEHPAFYRGSRLTLNITRRAMAEMGWCPSGRLFEAAACGCALLSDAWEGLDAFFTPGRDLLLASTTDEALAALDLADEEIARIARSGQERVLDEHTSAHRAVELEGLLAEARAGRPALTAA